MNEAEDEGFEFNEDGTWAYFFRNLEVAAVEGRYSVDGNLYTEESSTYVGCPYPGTYSWTLVGQRLTFAVSGEDECGVRVSSYSQTFVRAN